MVQFQLAVVAVEAKAMAAAVQLLLVAMVVMAL
jgi:hypothetical protein